MLFLPKRVAISRSAYYINTSRFLVESVGKTTQYAPLGRHLSRDNKYKRLAAIVILALIAYIKVITVKKLIVKT